MKKSFVLNFALCILHFALAPAFSANTVIWVSIDGMRYDTLDLYKPPTLCKLAAEGAFTKAEHPIFPSLTFPNHIAQVTGTTVDHSGVPMNGWWDSETKKAYSFPDESSLLRAEPIWATATRQGVRTLVIDWPMSHKQSGPNAAAYFGQRYDDKETDPHRLSRVIDLVRNDHADKPLRLIITYLPQVDQSEHRAGPATTRTADALLDDDLNLHYFLQAMVQWFDATHTADDELYVFVTTDHGMEPAKETENLDRLLGGPLKADTEVVTSGPMGTIWIDRKAVPDVAGRVKAIVRKLSAYPYLSVWPADAVPAVDHFSDPTRVGDVVVMCSPGYTFRNLRVATTQPTKDPLGMHGYDPAICPNMRGCAVVWRYRHPQGGIDLGDIDNTQWHATVAKLLGIEPAATADPRAVDVDAVAKK